MIVPYTGRYGARRRAGGAPRGRLRIAPRGHDRLDGGLAPVADALRQHEALGVGVLDVSEHDAATDVLEGERAGLAYQHAAELAVEVRRVDGEGRAVQRAHPLAVPRARDVVQAVDPDEGVAL